LLFENLQEEDVQGLKKSTILNLHKFAIDYSDAIIQGSSKIDKRVLNYIHSSEKPFMEYPGDENYLDRYQEFYDKFIPQEEELLLTE
jgi:starch synthase